ncbi:hypothetical protein [Shewanella baltica]|uniref:hypothetical protein n=2 Tax=Shewanella baltica TaxID=62322 RepID=UPI00216928D7|nr:hypothetical protein [Shewanella baltica]MCS6116664.1 hypothetical protein [Shewanella baltica]UVW66434.1 hypothetical protein HHE93_23165 [Shewanella baltica]
MQFNNASGSVDYGNIDSFIVLNDGFELEGDVGCIKVFCGKLRFDITHNKRYQKRARWALDSPRGARVRRALSHKKFYPKFT